MSAFKFAIIRSTSGPMLASLIAESPGMPMHAIGEIGICFQRYGVAVRYKFPWVHVSIFKTGRQVEAKHLVYIKSLVFSRTARSAPVVSKLDPFFLKLVLAVGPSRFKARPLFS